MKRLFDRYRQFQALPADEVSRELRDLAGCSPTQWLVEEQLPSVQDAAEYRSAH